jgi:hypothetical protein
MRALYALDATRSKISTSRTSEFRDPLQLFFNNNTSDSSRCRLLRTGASGAPNLPLRNGHRRETPLNPFRPAPLILLPLNSKMRQPLLRAMEPLDAVRHLPRR